MKLRYYLRGLGIGMVVTAMILIFASDTQASLSDEEIKARAAQLGMIESNSLTLADMQNMQGEQNRESQAEENQSASRESQAGESQSASQESQVGESQSTPQESQTGENQSASQESQAGESQSTSQESQAGAGQSASQESQAGESQSASQESQAGENQSQPQESQPAESQSPSQDAQTETSTGVYTSEPKVEDGVEIIEITIPGGTSSGVVCRHLAQAGLVESAVEYDNYLINNGYSRRIRVGTFKIPVGSGWQEIADIISTR